MTTKIDYLLEEIPSQYDLLILIGGSPWANDDFDIINLVNNTLNNLQRNGFYNYLKKYGNPFT